jgi:hypothetical protein
MHSVVGPRGSLQYGHCAGTGCALPAKHYAAELQRQLRSLLGHEQIVTQAYVQTRRRANRRGETNRAQPQSRYGAAFRSHNGRWEPLPGMGSLEEMADVVVTLLPRSLFASFWRCMAASAFTGCLLAIHLGFIWALPQLS